MTAANVNPDEIARFDSLAARWWDPDGESRPLHDLNPVRAAYVAARVDLRGANVADVGCGGGLLSEALARAGAKVTGVDLGEKVIDVAKLHLHESGLDVDYRVQSSAELAAAEPAGFDAVCCMELIEHVPDPAALVNDLAALLKPGGRLFMSTLNRTPAAFGAAIVGAEYVMRLLPRGTHHYAQFLKPSELGRLLRHAGLELEDVSGLAYNPLNRKARLSSTTAVNYVLSARKPA
ncbi:MULTISPECIES: bifunctional 2-polyprenyl-6-hydroxyphenol methylase/3-demethylubiquinol 3-O-methyltransferase UbiG [Rhodanobacter]|uniref:bifunctional 2-polyprenyl-6-hydroxyphenol methylase/3-demethylubiquinol 3-O-methyltransferase UbiG n=1 Tax=Rhodanobacter TaxID=75309 RepID=UPI000405BE44|nr:MULTISPECIES: bifunctional 2-polyprenyl-6-hydroxyphenol methylase/3-demethylubiquinol 3-O-methyltransferase UbiG [Rhodanobacter]KZC18915.1 bifunctional 3-demethylubiquinone 3-O-methyltransferase/2-octaprenyl-6-hydroxy phenol methylase [Rhodanobacter denitrificans]UJJ52247.1 bifunctional 2-polyprenyl-6-hydroxyphenol methylase/3-demethylubiquinol 3-O-methyltransferase UbiG [Rhodanobacter denitrificans]UJM94994.1 bifunctional 2-polyprenyl-6-hydroxyphenol methylase/3-demethylubiquinol 3-O-methylt